MARWLWFSLVGGFVGLWGCAPAPPEIPKAPERPVYHHPTTEELVRHGFTALDLVCLDPTAAEPVHLSNGLIGIRLGRDGFPVSQHGFLSPAFYQLEGEEKLVCESPSPFLKFLVNGSRVTDLPLEEYSQHLVDGVQVITRMSGSFGTVSVSCTLRRDVPMLVWEFDYQLAEGYHAEITAPVSGPYWTPFRLNGQDFYGKSESIAGERGIRNRLTVYADLEEAYRRIADARREPGVMERFVFPPPQEVPAIDSLRNTDRKLRIELVGPDEDQRAIQAMWNMLESSIHPYGVMSVAPMGLSSTIYNGHVFWDADIWVFPALALLSPDRAQAILDYRLSTEAQSRRNFQEWVTAGHPVGNSQMHTPDPRLTKLVEYLDTPPIKVAWESSVTGRETVPGPSRFQDHITGSVAFAMEKGRALGLVSRRDADRYIEGAAGFFLYRGFLGEDGKYRLHDTMSPDEHHIGDNDLYTNILAERWMRRALGARWPEDKVFLPRDEVSLLTYDDDRVRGYKQAAAVLAIYPLQDPRAEAQAMTMLGRFAPQVIPNGPAMSDSVHALIEARFGDPNQALETWRRSWVENTDYPFHQFSERRRGDRTVFVTGPGGCLQTVLFGFLGLRICTEPVEGAQWSLPLEDGWVLSCKPNMPDAWSRFTIEGLIVRGQRYRLVVSGQSSTLTPLSSHASADRERGNVARADALGARHGRAN